MPRGFLLDADRCTGCEACVLACTIENELPWGESWRRVETYNPGRHPGAPVFHLSLACNHCAEAPCADACPALAYSRDAATGAVLLDPERCIGCSYCAWVCPYDAPRFDETAGTMAKCTFCNDRLLTGMEPACVSACPTTALGQGELSALPGEPTVPGFPDRPVGPSIRFLGPDRGRFDRGSSTRPVSLGGADAGWRRLRDEWPLALFTWLASLLFALVAWTAHSAATLPAAAFVGIAGLAFGSSTLHLGRKERAWRAVLNLRRSWLSREIVTFAAFAAAGTVWTVLLPASARAGTLASLLGLLALFCIDRVYDPTGARGPFAWHSADVMITGPFLWAGLAGQTGWFLGLAALKLVLYLRRKIWIRESRIDTPLIAARLGIGILLPLGLWLALPDSGRPAILACLLLGEVVDRCEFYFEMRPVSPRREMDRALVRSLDSARSTPEPA